MAANLGKANFKISEKYSNSEKVISIDRLESVFKSQTCFNLLHLTTLMVHTQVSVSTGQPSPGLLPFFWFLFILPQELLSGKSLCFCLSPLAPLDSPLKP